MSADDPTIEEVMAAAAMVQEHQERQNEAIKVLCRGMQDAVEHLNFAMTKAAAIIDGRGTVQ